MAKGLDQYADLQISGKGKVINCILDGNGSYYNDKRGIMIENSTLGIDIINTIVVNYDNYGVQSKMM